MFEFLAVNTYWLICFFILGALWGSFANVVILRLPQGKSIILPSSSCPKCNKKISWYDLIPIFSWFFLKGKCRNCASPISTRYPLVEFLTALLFMLSFWKFGWSFYLFEVLILVLGLVIVSFIDIDHFIIPDKISLPGIAIGLIGSLINPDRSFIDSLLGVLLGGGFLWMIAYVYLLIKKQEGMGGGDIKLLAWMGAVTGWISIPFIILFSSIMGSIVGLYLMRSSKDGLKTVVPFGPYLAIACLIFLFTGKELSTWYFGLFFPWIND